MYEAGDLLLGDHLTEKSDTVKWVDVTMPHQRSRRLKDHRVLQDMAKANPESDDIFEGNLLENFYSKRPDAMEDVCLYDFVSKYDYAGKDEDGARKYKLLKKPRLPNHKIFNPEKEDQKEAYYYSLLLLFVPFREESELLEDDETAEEAFKRLVTDNSKAYHEKLHKALQAQATVKETRRAEAKDEKEEKDNKEDDEPQLMGEANSAMNDLMDLNANNADDKSNQLSLRDTLLNVDQRRIFENVKSHLVHHKTTRSWCMQL